MESVRPTESGGTRYCPVCPGAEGCYYFTPGDSGPPLVLSEARIAHVDEIPMKFIDGQQQPLIETGEKWQEHWKQMPEFVQENLKPFKSISVHFESRADMEKFSKLIHQPISLETQFVWYPEAEIERYATKRWVGKSNGSEQ